MKARFEQHIQSHFPFLLDAYVLLAVSGGLDSMVLLHLCDAIGIHYGIAHCNFKLRGEESNEDARFVSNLALPPATFKAIKEVDMTAFAKANKSSIQLAARDFRYAWFDELLTANNFDYVLTAHHANDNLETMLINLGRGTGLDGISGIPAINGNRVRVLLPFSRKQLKKYATDEHIEWREDSSNASDKYLRNNIRHHAIPALEEAMPNLLKNGVQLTKHYLDQTNALLKAYEIELAQTYTYPIKSTTRVKSLGIDLLKLNKHATPNAVLYALLKQYKFTAWDDIYSLREAQPGKHVFSATHRLVNDRDQFIVSPIEKDIDFKYEWDDMDTYCHGTFGALVAVQTDDTTAVDRSSIIVDVEKLKLPLIVRKWQHGDIFHPLGMGGRKKLSKYFKDEKLSLIEKENVWLLCSENDIIWIIGHRADDRFKASDKTTQRLLITHVDATH